MPESELKNQTLTRLDVSNFMRVEQVEILVDGQVVVVGGDNTQGKSSVLLAIEAAFGGTRNICDQPVRKGRSKAHVIAETQDLIVTRKFTANGGSSLTVTTKEGSPLSKPQEVLDSLLGSLSFDPLYFSRLAASNKAPDKAKAVETLRAIVGIDFAPLDAAKVALVRKREAVNAQLAPLPVKLEAFPPEAGAPAEEVDVKALQQELTDAVESNNWRLQKLTDIRDAKTALNSLDDKIAYRKNILASREQWLADTLAKLKARYEQEVEAATRESANSEGANKAELESLDGARNTQQSQVSAIEQLLAAAKAEVPLEDIKKRICDTEITNQKVRHQKRRKELLAEQKRLSDEADKITEELLAIDNQKTDLLAKAKFPVPEISFSDAEVLLDGLPFSQGSTAQQLRASVSIGMALNPKFRVMLIRQGGNDLDEKGLQLIADMAKERDFQVWIERVGNGKEVTVEIVDGKIKED